MGILLKKVQNYKHFFKKNAMININELQMMRYVLLLKSFV